MPIYTQDTRPFRLETPLGKDVLLCTSWTCTETVSSLFELRVAAQSERGDIEPRELLLKPVSLLCTPPGGHERRFTGIVRHVARPAAGAGRLTEYVLSIVPPAWLLSLGSGYEVHQDLDLKALLAEVLSAAPVKWELQGSFPVVPSRTRYDESRWTFANRLFEREGIWYTFTHTATSCTMLVANSMASATVQHGVTELRDTDWEKNARLVRFATEQAPFIKTVVVGTSQQALFGKDNREQAAAPAFPATPGRWPLDPSTLQGPLETQLYEYVTGGSFDAFNKTGGDTTGDLSKLVQALRDQAKLEAERGVASSSRLVGASTATGLMAGAKVGLHCDGQPDKNGQYFVLSVEHRGESNSYVAGDGQAWSYANNFVAIPHSVSYRPPRVTPWPAVPGVHVATVVGPSGEEIFTDKFGRVRVVFEWNRDAKLPNGPGDSCWVRVAQLVSGPGWGSFFLPRIGHQVIVSFLGADPDQPLIVGSLYNDVNLPQIKLPDDKTQSAIRTRSSPRGTAEMYNELRFEDKKGDEQVVFQAQKDFIGLIKHDSTLTVREGNQTVTVEQGDQSMTVTQGKLTVTVEKDHATTVKSGDLSATISAGKSTHEAQGNVALTSKGAKMLLEAAQDVSVKSTGGKVTITSPTSIELTVGGSSIKLTPAGVEIAGMQLKASGSAAAEVSGGGALTLKGGVVMIN